MDQPTSSRWGTTDTRGSGGGRGNRARGSGSRDARRSQVERKILIAAKKRDKLQKAAAKTTEALIEAEEEVRALV